MIYFPKSPTKLPNIAAKNALLGTSLPSSLEDKLINDVNNVDSFSQYNGKKFTIKTHLFNWYTELKTIFSSLSSLLIVLLGGFQCGLFIGYTGVFQDMLSPLGLSDDDIGLIGFVTTLLMVFGGLIMGYIADKCFTKKLKKLLMFLFIINIILLIVLFVILPTPFNGIYPLTTDNCPNLLVYLLVIIGITGIFSGGSIPLFYELAAEICAPVSEGSSATFITFILNGVALLYIGVGNWLNTSYETLFALIGMIGCLIALIFVKEIYIRDLI